MTSYIFTSLLKLGQRFNLKQNTISDLFGQLKLPPFELGERLLADLAEAKHYPLYTEKAKSEFVITPILKELKRKNPNISLFSGFSLNIESEPDLCGSPDFVLSAKANLVEIEAPIFCLVESKNKAPDEGFAQCAAEMYAARLFNQEMSEPYETIYGSVTNAFEWVFMKLEGDTIYVDKERYYLNELSKLLSVMQFIINQQINHSKNQ